MSYPGGKLTFFRKHLLEPLTESVVERKSSSYNSDKSTLFIILIASSPVYLAVFACTWHVEDAVIIRNLLVAKEIA